MRLDKLGEMFMMSCWKKERLARVEIHLSKSISKTGIFTGGKGYPLKALFLALFSQGNLTKVNEMRSFRGFRIFHG